MNLKSVLTRLLRADDLCVVEARELVLLLKNNRVQNHQRDIQWLEANAKDNCFDFFLGVGSPDSPRIFGCVQKLKGEVEGFIQHREFSDKAMKAFFWSAAIVLDGDFLRLPLFKGMVNGNTETFQTNGWHGLYVFSTKYSEDRIYAIDDKMKTFVAHAKLAAKQWVEQRQWLNAKWRADK